MPASLFSFSREELVSEVMNTLCLSVTSSGVEVRIYNGGGKLLDELHDFLLPITISWQGYYLLNIEAVGWILTALWLNSTCKKAEEII